MTPLHRFRLLARRTLGELLYRARLQREHPTTLCVLMYHAVTEDRIEDHGQQSVPAELFDAQMAFLRGLGYPVVPLEEGVRLLQARAPGGPWISVTFDDGYAGVYQYAAGILRRHRIPAVLFLATGSIGHDIFPWSDPELGRPLRWEEVRSLMREVGCSVGSHSHSHTVLTALDPDAIRREVVRSRAEILRQTGVRPRLFAYPYGSTGTFDARTCRILVEEGFPVACTSLWGRQAPKEDPMRIKRIRVSWCDSPRELHKSISGCYDWYPAVQVAQAAASMIK